MNQRTTYELTIAEKLQQVSIPDMREAIWSRIEDQLDIDMPEDDPNGPDSPDTWNWKIFTRKFGMFAAVVAVVTTVFLMNKKSTESSLPKTKTPETVSPQLSTPGTDKTKPPGQTVIHNNSPLINNADTGISVVVNDSVFNDPVVNLPPPVIDTTPKTVIPDNTKIAVIPQDTTKKKSKGFKGITENDYRINLKKDSIP